MGQSTYRKGTALLTLCCLCACSHIERRVEGWPQDMKIVVHPHSGFWEINKICWRDLPLYWKLLGAVCPTVATLNLVTNTCDIYTLGEEPSEHELEHCRGGDHDGLLQGYYDRWKAAGSPREAPAKTSTVGASVQPSGG